MGQINLYKIDNQKHEDFIDEIEEKFDLINNIEMSMQINDEELNFEITLYTSIPNNECDISWNWVLNAFDVPRITNTPNPKAVLIISKSDILYTITFGYSFFIVDKFCDRTFGFELARKIKYKEIKTTSLIAPNSKKNKTVNTYVNYNNLEFDSGESFAKIKAKMDIPSDFELHTESIEIGNSIKFNIVNESLETIVKLIVYIENIIENNEVINYIPLFNRVKDQELILELDNRLKQNISNNPLCINISEIDIIGATEIFNHNDSTFTLKYRRISKDIFELDSQNIQNFITDNNLVFDDCILDISVKSKNNGVSVKTDPIKRLIDYIDDEKRCVLYKGDWYFYNDDYLTYLYNSIEEIDTTYEEIYNLSKQAQLEFQNNKYIELKDDAEYTDKTAQDIMSSIKRKFYAERTYNIMLCNNYGFILHDRVDVRFGNASIELMDLYKEETMYAVKIGDSSAKLCYAVDQSISSLKAYKHNSLPNMPLIKNVCVWLILKRTEHLEIINGKVNLNELNMIMLKNKLDSWKKEVRVLGYNPIVRINYVVD